MITVIKQGNAYNRRVISLEGLSTDTKPVEYFIETDSNGVEVAKVYIENGSTFTEIDTGKLFMYDAENTVWYEIETSGGGGGGGGTTNYNALSNKPKINSIELSGNKSLSDLSLYSKSEVDIALATKANTTDVDIVLGNKVDKVNGKGLSENDYTDAEKTKLSNIESEANKTIVDSTLSTTSTNPVQNKVINIALSGKQDTISDLETIRTDAELGATAVQPEAGKGLSTNDFTNQDKEQITTNKNGLAAVANAGAKNNGNFNFGGVVPNVNVKPGTIVCTEDNGVFSFSGTADDKNYAAYILKQFLLRAGTYRISGISGGSNTTYWMRTGTGTTDAGLFNLYDGEREFNLVSDTLITIQFVIYANQTVSNLIIKPMIRPASIEDNTFVPYAPTNRELYEMILALQSGT